KQFGHSHEKWIPEEFFSAPIEVREALMNALLLGDGKTGNNRNDKPKWNTDKAYRIFFSASGLLADGFERLAISLGYPTSRKLRPDKRKDTYFDIHEVSLLLRREVRSGKKHYHITEYSGMVYCAEVPGGLLFTKRGNHPLWSGNSQAAGVTLFLTNDTKKSGKTLKTKVINVKTGAFDWLTPEDMHRETVAFPGEFVVKDGRWVSPDNEVVSLQDGKQVVKHPSVVKYMLASADGLFDMSSNTIPFIQSNQANRLLTSSKMSTQTSPLANPEKPLVDVLIANKSVLDVIGDKYSIHSKVSGVVKEVNEDYITVSDSSGHVRHNIPNNIPLNSDAFIDSVPRVKPGQKVKKGELLADTNHTIDGKMVSGVNLNIAYLPYHGLNYEDSTVITESAAQRLATQHIYRVHVPKENIFDIKKYRAYSPYDIKDEDMGRYDDKGIIHKGEEIHPDDILAASMQKRVFSMADSLIQRLKKSSVQPYKANPVAWGRTMPGVVTDVREGKDGYDIYVKTTEPVLPGDKLVGRHGNKTTVSTIIPDADAPVTAAGDRIDI
ncbi:MAG: hypothetical protein Q8M92_00610, partial [Candidatus Subteraquimicrobiales bacterium]|nr:hypothetical protein [Candidatus Subteraquimicrobiales bacterium]